MARVVKGYQFISELHGVYLRLERITSAFAFPAEAGSHSPTPEGWKAELA